METVGERNLSVTFETRKALREHTRPLYDQSPLIFGMIKGHKSLQDLEHLRNVIICSVINISCKMALKFAHKFLSYLANKQTHQRRASHNLLGGNKHDTTQLHCRESSEERWWQDDVTHIKECHHPQTMKSLPLSVKASNGGAIISSCSVDVRFYENKRHVWKLNRANLIRRCLTVGTTPSEYCHRQGFWAEIFSMGKQQLKDADAFNNNCICSFQVIFDWWKFKESR